MTPQQKLVELALKEVGVRESGGNNRGARIVEYQKATWLEPGAWPWCAAFICWLIREWLKDAAVREHLSLRNDKEVEAWRPQTASAFDFEKWARRQDQLILPETELAQAGDLVIFDFSHIGIVIGDQLAVNLDTVEGNTNGQGERDSQSGDGVWRKRRHRSLTKCYIQWRFNGI